MPFTSARFILDPAMIPDSVAYTSPPRRRDDAARLNVGFGLFYDGRRNRYRLPHDQ